MFIVPWLSVTAPKERLPAPAANTLIVLPAAFVSVPLVTFRTALPEPVSSIVPLFVKPFATVRESLPPVASTLNVEPAWTVSVPLIALEPLDTSMPPLVNAVLIVLEDKVKVLPDGFVIVTAPFMDELVVVRTVSAVERLSDRVTVELLRDRLPIVEPEGIVAVRLVKDKLPTLKALLKVSEDMGFKVIAVTLTPALNTALPMLLKLRVVRVNPLLNVAAVMLLNDRPPSVKPLAKVTALQPLKDKLPNPLSVPVLGLKVPPLMLTVFKAAIEIVPVLVKLGVVPDCVRVRASFTLIVPLLVWAADILLIVRGWLMPIVP